MKDLHKKQLRFKIQSFYKLCLGRDCILLDNFEFSINRGPSLIWVMVGNSMLLLQLSYNNFRWHSTFLRLCNLRQAKCNLSTTLCGLQY